MTEYRAIRHYQDETVASAYDAQYSDPVRLSNLKAKLFGWCEERAFLHMLRRVPPGGTVLDLPAGTGRYVRHLLARGYQVGGADVSEEMLQVARRRVGHHPNLLFLEAADAACVPYPDGRFDGVTCIRLYHLVPPDVRQKMLREVKRVGRGWAILYFGMTNRWLELRRAVRSRVDDTVSDPYPVTMQDLRQELEAAGMHLEESRWVLRWLADGLVARVSW